MAKKGFGFGSLVILAVALALIYYLYTSGMFREGASVDRPTACPDGTPNYTGHSCPMCACWCTYSTGNRHSCPGASNKTCCRSPHGGIDMCRRAHVPGWFCDALGDLSSFAPYQHDPVARTAGGSDSGGAGVNH